MRSRTNSGWSRRSFLRWLAGMGLATILPACRDTRIQPSPATTPQGVVPTTRFKRTPPWRIGRAGLGDLSSWWIMLSAHTEYGIKERHSDVFREYLSTSANWDADKQALDIERLASAGLDLLLVEPLNSPLVASAVSRVQKLGLPVILVSGNLAGADYVSWVTTDEEERGRASASWLTRRVTGGRVIVLQSEPAQGDGQAWLEGVRDGLAAAPGLDIEYATSFWTVADSRRLVELALDRDPALAGLVVNHGTVAQGAVEALVERGLTIPPVAGADDNNGWLRTAREHRVSFLGFGGSSRLGLRSVELAVDVLSGNSVPVRCQQVQEVFDETAIEQLYRPELTDHYWANHELQETWIQAMFGRPG